ncbi:MAG: DUF421 domain-containing protein [Bacillota bacterium]
MNRVFAVFYRTVVIYFMVLLVMRLMGKREIGQLSPFDFVVAIIIAEVAALPMEEPEIPLLRGLLPLFVLAGLEVVFSYAALHSRWFRRMMCGTPQLVIWDGQILHREMRRARYNLDDLMAQLREKGYPDPAEVACAVLENSGRLSVVPRGESQPVTRGDLGLESGSTGLPRILVADGEVLDRNLAAVGRGRAWLEKELEARGFSLPGVFLVSLSPDGRLFVSPREGFGRVAAKENQMT